MKNILSLLWIFFITFGFVDASAAEPNGYYLTCEGKNGASLLSQLHTVVGNHTNVGYDGLWSLYKTTDTYPDGSIWDMYSTKKWKYSSDQCGSYKNVGDCYNREHSMPKSWFNEAAPMVADAFHIYPTDGKVNGQRSNYPYGECANGTTLAGNGNVKALGKLGKSTFSGYSGTVFEPDDEYKGDFARSYFYMAAAYNSQIKNWDSDMLAGNSYPAFSSWAVNLLLKWHRQDPVSQKEIDRNEAVYKSQKNRNPFIDHPELAEHIWGDKKGQPWNGTTSEPELTLPVSGTTINLGTTMTGVSRTASVVVKGTSLSGNVTVAVSGAAFTASSSSFSASAANTTNGYTVTITFSPQAAGTFNGTLTVSCGNLSSTVNLTGVAMSTIPAGPVTGVSDDSFEAVWAYVGDDDGGYYTLDVKGVSGYPKKVNARAERFVVEDLEPATTYTYTISSKNHTSDAVTVTTLEPIPSVVVMFDGDLVFNAAPGEPSDIAELLLEIDNIFSDISLSVNAPFQLSEDKTAWSTSIKISPEQDRVYLRMLSQDTGTFAGTLVITAGEYHNDDVDFIGTSSANTGLYEDFEANSTGFGNYNGGIYTGTACKWKLTNAGIYPSDAAHGGNQAVRFGKDKTSAVEMQENSRTGIGTVTLWAHKWNGDANTTFLLEYSSDGGSSWQQAGSATLSATSYSQFTFTINSVQPVRLRLRQTDGSRWLVDDIEATAYYNALVPDAVADYHRWDAFCRSGQMVIEAAEPVEAHVYALDGTEVFVGMVPVGETVVSATPGLYIVVVDDFSRRVLVK